jgi:tetratricopeptide (TPR) repeat protein
VLHTAAARLFRLLGLHPGPDITVGAAASLAGLPAEQARSLLAELTRTHLLMEQAPGRYILHDLLHAYATELAHTHDTVTERGQALHRMLDHYLHAAHAAAALLEPHRETITIEPAIPDIASGTLTTFGQAQAWLTREHQVLVQLVGQAAERGFGTHAWQLAWTLITYFHRRGDWHDQAATLHIALKAARRHNDPLGQAYSRLGLSRAYLRTGRHEEAHDQLRQALDLFIRCDHKAGQARIHDALGFIHTSSGRYREALEHLQTSLDLFLACGSRHGAGEVLNSLGWNHALLGHYKLALDYCHQALALQQELGDRHGQASTWDSLGYVNHHLGHHEHASSCYQQALRLFREVDERYLEADTLTRLGDHHHAQGDLETTRAVWLEALEILDELNHPDTDRVRAKLKALTTTAASITAT